MRSTKRGWYQSLTAILAAITVSFSCTGHVNAADSAYSDLIQEEITQEDLLLSEEAEDGEILLDEEECFEESHEEFSATEETADVAEDPEKPADDDAEFEAVNRFKLSIKTDANTSLIESSLQGAEKVGSEYLVGESNSEEENDGFIDPDDNVYDPENSLSPISFSVKIADSYRLDEENTYVVVTSAGKTYTLYGKDDFISYDIGDDDSVRNIRFSYADADLPYGGDVEFNIKTYSIITDYTLTLEGGLSVAFLPEDSGLVYRSDKKYHVLLENDSISAFLSVPVNKMPKGGDFDKSNFEVLYNGTPVDEGLYRCDYSRETGFCEFSYELPCDNYNIAVPGDITVKATLVADTAKSSYSFSWSGDHIKVTPDSELNGILRRTGDKSFLIDPEATGFYVDLIVDEGYMVDVDSEGNLKGTIGGKSWINNDNVNCDYCDGVFSFSYDFPVDEKTDQIKRGNVSIAPTIVSEKTGNTFSVDSGSTGYITIDPSTVEEGSGLIYDSSKYYQRRGETEFTAILKVNSNIADDFTTDGLRVKFGDITLSSDNYDFYAQYDNDSGLVTLNVYREYYANEDDEETRLRSGNIVVSYKAQADSSDRTSYTLSVGTGLMIDPEDPDSVDGLQYDTKTKKWYILNTGDKISATIKVAEGYYYQIPEDGEVVATVKFGDKKADEFDYGFSYDEDEGSFSFSYTFKENEKTEKTAYGNVSFSVALQSLIKVSLSYDNKLFRLTNDASECFYNSADNKAFYVKKGEDLIFKVEAAKGYRIDSVKNGKQILTPMDEEEAPEYYDDEYKDLKAYYKISKLTSATTVTVLSKQCPGVTVTPVIDEKKDSKNATVVFEGVDTVSGKYVTKNEDIIIKITPAQGRVIADVDYSTEDSDGKLSPEADGSYIIPSKRVRSLAEEGNEIFINISTDEEPVNVFVSVNGQKCGYDGIDKLLDFWFSNGADFDSKLGEYRTEVSFVDEEGYDSTIDMVILPYSEGVSIDSVKYKIGKDGKFKELTKYDERRSDEDAKLRYYYKIDRTEVDKAKKDRNDIYIEIEGSKKEPKKVTFKPADGITYCTYLGDGRVGNRIDGTIEADYGLEYKFVVYLDDEKASTSEIKAVKYGSKTLKLMDDGFHKYYTLGKIQDNKPATVETVVEVKRILSNISIVADGNVESINVSVDGENMEYSDVLKILSKSKVVLTVNCKEGYTVGDVTCSGGTKITVKGREISFTAPEKNETITIKTTGEDCTSIQSESGTVDFRGKANLTMTTEEKATVKVVAGGKLIDITGIKLKNIKEETGFATVAGTGTIVLDGKAAKGVSKKITLSIFCQGEKKARQVDIVVKQKPSAITVSGFKKGKAKLAVGTTAVYPVKLNEKFDYKGLKVSVVSRVNATVTLDTEERTLTVQTFKGSSFAKENEDILFNFVGKDGSTIGSEFVITPVKASLAVPAVKVTGSDDTSVTLSLSLPKGVSDYKNLKYVIEATAVTTKKNPQVAQGMKASVKKTVDVTETSATLKLSDNKNGTAQKYNVVVKLVQYTGSSATEVFSEGKAAKVSAATKNPGYETKLALVKKQTSFTIYEKDVLLATAKFRAATTFKTIAKAEIIAQGSETALLNSGKGEILIQDGNVIVKDTTKFAAGKYTLKVYPVAAEGAGKPATLTIVVKAPVTNIKLTANTGRLYKIGNKAATVKVNASCISSKSEDGKPASNKVEWTITSSNEELRDAVSVKDGVVTVAKTYIPTGDKSKDTFTVKATAADLGSSNSKAATDQISFFVTSEMVKPVGISAEGVDNLKNPVAGDKLNGATLVVTDPSGKAIDLSLVTITVSPKKGMTITPDGKISVTKKGKYTVKVTANDGSKSKYTQKIKIN